MSIAKGCLGKLIRPKIFTSKNISNKPKPPLNIPSLFIKTANRRSNGSGGKNRPSFMIGQILFTLHRFRSRLDLFV